MCSKYTYILRQNMLRILIATILYAASVAHTLTITNYALNMNEGPYVASPDETVTLQLAGFHNLWEFATYEDYAACNFDVGSATAVVQTPQLNGEMTFFASQYVGDHYYACQVASHCQSGAKFIIQVTEPSQETTLTPLSVLIRNNTFGGNIAILVTDEV